MLANKYSPEILPVALTSPVTYSPVEANTATFGVPATLTVTLLFTAASIFDVPFATGKAAALKKYGGATIASPFKALELIAAAKSNTLGQGFDAEDQVLADLTMSDPLRA